MDPREPLVGQSVHRREDPTLVTGRGVYTGDVILPGMVHLAVVRSPYAHAVVRSIDISDAKVLPGLIGIITPDQVSDVRMPPVPNQDENIPRRFPLVQGRVLMPGDPIVAVIAEKPDIAMDGADLVAIDYEPLPVVGSIDTALKAPPIYPEMGSNVAYDFVVGDRHDFESLPGPIRIEGLVEHPRVVPSPIETRVIVADWKPDQLVVYLSTQAPHLAQEELAKSFDLPASSVRVITRFVGGAFGCKLDFAEEEYLAVIASRLTGRPVRWEERRREHFLTIGHGRGQRSKYELVAGSDGVIQGLWTEWLVDLGCRCRYIGFVSTSPRMETGCYDIPVHGWRLRGVWTNRSPRGIYRGAERPEAILTIERAIDQLAAELDIDPAEIRRRNFVQPDQFPYVAAHGHTYDSGDYPAALDELLHAAGYSELRSRQSEGRRRGELVGIGLAAYVEICTFEPWGAARVQINRDGSVTAHVETLDQGQGHRTAFAQLVADPLGIPVDRIRIEQGDTAFGPPGFGTAGSRSIPQGGAAVHHAAGLVAEKVRRIASRLLEADPRDIDLVSEGALVKGTDQGVTWREIVKTAYHASPSLGEEYGLTSEHYLESGGRNFPFGAHLAEVEVDGETGAVKLVNMWAVDDAGIIVNPMLARGQRHGGLAQGIGQALWEEAHYDDDGNLATSTFVDYLIPTASGLPSFRLAETCTPTETNALGARGIGESATIGSTAAVLNAVCDALSVQDLQIPLRPDRIWQVLSQRARNR